MIEYRLTQKQGQALKKTVKKRLEQVQNIISRMFTHVVFYTSPNVIKS